MKSGAVVVAQVAFKNTTIAPNHSYNLPTLPEGMRPGVETVAPAFITNGYSVAIAYGPDGTGYMMSKDYGASDVNVFGILSWIV